MQILSPLLQICMTLLLIAGSHISILVAQTSNSSSYCTPNLSPETYIHNIKFANLNVSTGSNNGYGDFSSFTANVSQGTTETLRITPSNTTKTLTYEIWIDFNKDFDFLDQGERFTFTSRTGIANLPIAIPASAMTGETRMRIALFDGIVPTIFPLYCASSGAGEFEDYSINIQSASGGGEDDYCVPKLGGDDYYIYRVKLGTINNVSGNNDGYADFSNLSTDLSKGTAQSITVVPNNMNATYRYYIWADLNRDNDFVDSGELLLNQSSTGTLNTNIIIPGSTANGPTRLRIAMFNGPIPKIFPLYCARAGRGEMEDYTINIQNMEQPPSNDGYCTPNPSTGNGIFSANLSGDEEVPPISTSASGRVMASLSGNTLSLSGSFKDLQSKFNAQIGAHIHRASAGSNGPVVFPLRPTFDNQDSVSGVFKPSENSFTLNNNQLQELQNGNYYINIHTLNFPSGELRGQLMNRTVFINRLALGTINNTSGDNGGYGDFSNQVAEVQKGQSQNITIQPNDMNNVNNYRVWVDFNQDNDFEDAGELVVTSSSNNTLSTSFNIPASALSGNTRMRVAIFSDVVPAIFPLTCVRSGTGEFEDYTLNIQNEAPPVDNDGYCTPRLNSNSLHIQRVLFESINNVSGNNGGYGNFTDLSTTLRAGQRYFYIIWSNKNQVNKQLYIWIDLNQDNDFEDAGELVSVQNTAGTLTSAFLLPSNARTGQTRMRIAVFENKAPSISPLSCVKQGNGEFEDYNVIIQGGTGKPDDGNPKYCDIRGTSTYEYIDRVRFANIDNKSGNNNGYGNFTGQTANVNLGSRVPIEITPGFRFGRTYPEYFFVYIDFNLNGTFEHSELVYHKRIRGKANGNISIPNNAGLMGRTTRMRVVMKYYSTKTTCGIFNYGEVEDYTIRFSRSAVTNETKVSSRSAGENTLRISPNPTPDFLRIKLEQEVKQADVLIFDMQGKIVYQNNMDLLDSRLDLLDLVPGVYRLHIRSKDFTKTESFIKM